MGMHLGLLVFILSVRVHFLWIVHFHIVFAGIFKIESKRNCERERKRARECMWLTNGRNQMKERNQDEGGRRNCKLQ